MLFDIRRLFKWAFIWIFIIIFCLKATPRCLRRADSGMPQEELTPRSDSVSTEASGGSPPDNSETSSGVHSNSSRESAQRRSTSVDDLATDAANKVYRV